jgi:ribosomal protein S18 acetylase RimI-like enzyme
MDHIVIEKVDEGRNPQMLDFVRQQYMPRERMSVTSGLHLLPFDYLRDHLLNWLLKNVSLSAIDQRTDQIVGISINSIVKKTDIKKEDIDWPFFELKAVVTTLMGLEENYDIFEKTGSDEGLKLELLGVHSDYGGLGIAQRLTLQTIQLARSKNCGFVVSNPTSPMTFHIFPKVGFSMIERRKLMDHYVDEQIAFPSAQPDDFYGLVVMKL